MDDKVIPAGRFKQECLALLDRVAASHEAIVVTKRGRPVARIVPVEDPRDRESEILGKLRGSVRVLVPEAELLRPTTDVAGWSLGTRRSR